MRPEYCDRLVCVDLAKSDQLDLIISESIEKCESNFAAGPHSIEKKRMCFKDDDIRGH